MPDVLTRPDAGQPFLKVENLSFSYRRDKKVTPALSNLTLEVAAGEFICLVGPSGCGKSSLLRILSGLEKPERRETISWYGKPPRTGMIFQKASAFPWMTVLKNVEYGIDRSIPKKQRTAKATEWIERMGLGPHAHHRGAELSGGMAQRVAIARALAADTELLLLDEPFAAVDEPTRIQLQQDLLEVWSAARPTVFFVTHSISEALLLADRVVLMTAVPASVHSIIEPPFERPRELMQIQADGEYPKLANTLWTGLQSEMIRQRSVR